MTKRGKPIPDKVLKEVYERQRGRCAFCNCVQLDTAPHHVKYRSRGGSNEAKNLKWLCRPCHNRAHKGDPELARFRTYTWQEEGQTEADAQED